MRISQVRLKGFRNFRDATINFSEKSLIIGANEIGKSNLLYALRILLDKNFSEADLEPHDSDFYVYEETNEIEIRVKFEEVCQDCVLSKLREHVSDDGTAYLVYRAARDPASRKKTYQFLAGRSEDTLAEIASRFYLKVLNLQFVGSYRDLASFIRRERRSLLQDAMDERQEGEIDQDAQILGDVQQELTKVHAGVRSLSYVSRATDSLNAELAKLSFQSTGQTIIFDTGASDPSRFVENLRLASQVGERTLAVGGDGRTNQIHLALWAARRNKAIPPEDEPLEVTIFCIEEPEAHLHPHQQRRLASYLAETLQAQVIITTHSPQIVCEFPPSCIVRLYNHGPDTLAAGGGSSSSIAEAFIGFGHRLNIIPAEAFFASIVLLVEGPSEELFYKALADKIGIDLDRFNISILMVDGIGFQPYISLLRSLNIDFVMRTDNDIFRVPQQEVYRFAGVQRCIEIYRTFFERQDALEQLLAEHEAKLQGFASKSPPAENLASAHEVMKGLAELGIYLSDIDLERDLYHSELADVLTAFTSKAGEAEAVEEMQKRKATFMFAFLQRHSAALSSLKDSPLATPLLRCREIVEGNS